MTAGGLWSCLDHRWRWSWRGRGSAEIVGWHHAGEHGCDGGCGRWLGWRSLGWDGSRGCGPMRNEKGPAVDSRCGVLRIAWFSVTWKLK